MKNETLNYIIVHRNKKPNKNTIKMFETYLEEVNMNEEILEEFKQGLPIDMFESQVKDYFS